MCFFLEKCSLDLKKNLHAIIPSVAFVMTVGGLSLPFIGVIWTEYISRSSSLPDMTNEYINVSVPTQHCVSLYPGTHSNCMFKFPEFSLCQFVSITYTELTWQTCPASGKKWIFLRQLSQYPLLLESEHLQLELSKFPVFSLCLDNIPCVFPVF